MNPEMLNLSPQEFVDRTQPCPDGRRYIKQSTSMEVAWDRCSHVDWLLWCLGKLGATGFTDYARWCVEQIPVDPSKLKSELGELNLILQAESNNAAFDAAVRVITLAYFSGQADNPTEIKRRWGNPFRKEKQTSDIINIDDELVAAARMGATAEVATLLDRGANIHALEDLALREAVIHGRTSTVELLLDRDANMHALEDEALRLAAVYGQTDMVRLLLARGADPSVHGNGALRRAIMYKRPEIIEILKTHIR